MINKMIEAFKKYSPITKHYSIDSSYHDDFCQICKTSNDHKPDCPYRLAMEYKNEPITPESLEGLGFTRVTVDDWTDNGMEVMFYTPPNNEKVLFEYTIKDGSIEMSILCDDGFVDFTPVNVGDIASLKAIIDAFSVGYKGVSDENK